MIKILTSNDQSLVGRQKKLNSIFLPNGHFVVGLRSPQILQKNGKSPKNYGMKTLQGGAAEGE